MFPFIPLLALIVILGGGTTLAWYGQLSKEQKQEADRIAFNYAKEVFGKGLKELTSEQAKHVAMLTKRHFSN